MAASQSAPMGTPSERAGQLTGPLHGSMPPSSAPAGGADRPVAVAERLRQASVGRGLRAGGHEGRRAVHQPRVVARPVEAEHARAAAGVQRGERGAALSRANGRAGPALGRQWFWEGARAVQTLAPVRGGGERANLRPSSVVQARARAHSRVRLSAPRWRAEAAQPRGRYRPRAAPPPRRRPLRRAAPLGAARARREGAAQSGAPKAARARLGVHAAVAVLHKHAVDAVGAPGGQAARLPEVVAAVGRLQPKGARAAQAARAMPSGTALGAPHSRRSPSPCAASAAASARLFRHCAHASSS